MKRFTCSFHPPLLRSTHRRTHRYGVTRRSAAERCSRRYHGLRGSAERPPPFRRARRAHGLKTRRAGRSQGPHLAAKRSPWRCKRPSSDLAAARLRARRLHPHHGNPRSTKTACTRWWLAHRGAWRPSILGRITRTGTASACEAFLYRKEKSAARHILPGPALKKPVERIKEASYFFRLSNTSKRLPRTLLNAPRFRENRRAASTR